MILTQTELELAKKIAHEVWEKYDDTHGYRTEKLAFSDTIPTNHPDNIWGFWNQFDSHNQAEFYERLVYQHGDEPGAAKLMAWCVIEINRTLESISKLRDAGIDI